MILGYVRVSAELQAGPDKTSLDSQEQAVHGYALMRGHSKFDVQIFCDAGVSGATKFKMRPGGEDLLKIVKPGDIVVASKLDRMFRSTIDALTMIEEFRKLEVGLVLLNISTSSLTDRNDPMGQFSFTIFSAAADMERSLIRERTNEGRRAKKAKGGAIAHAPFGFRKVGERGAAQLEVDPREQAIIAFAKAREKKMTLRAISRELAEAGYLSRRGKLFHAFSISNILEQQVVNG